MTQSLDKKSQFTTQIPRDERLCLVCKKNNNYISDKGWKNMFYCTVLGMSRLENNYIIA